MPIRKSTRFYVTESDYLELLSNSRDSLEIIVNPSMGNHPKGKYLIPNDIAIDFIKRKRGTPNWDKHQNFKQDSIPSELIKYFIKTA